MEEHSSNDKNKFSLRKNYPTMEELSGNVKK